MSEDIKFPEPMRFVEAIETEKVAAWFKRAMLEFPNERDSPYLCNVDGMIEWYEKWFSQFEEEK